MKSVEDLIKIREYASNRLNLKFIKNGYRIVVGMATCGITAGAKPVLDELEKECKEQKLDNVIVTQVGCIGECALEPIVEVVDSEGTRTTYCKVKVTDVKRIINDHIMNHILVNDLLISKYKH